MRSARGFKEAFEDMASVNLFSSSLIREPSSSCSLILFLEPESDDGGAMNKCGREIRAGIETGVY